jgi:hypothetical protein
MEQLAISVRSEKAAGRVDPRARRSQIVGTCGYCGAPVDNCFCGNGCDSRLYRQLIWQARHYAHVWSAMELVTWGRWTEAQALAEVEVAEERLAKWIGPGGPPWSRVPASVANGNGDVEPHGRGRGTARERVPLARHLNSGMVVNGYRNDAEAVS